jgi:hypothetical protein
MRENNTAHQKDKRLGKRITAKEKNNRKNQGRSPFFLVLVDGQKKARQ